MILVNKSIFQLFDFSTSWWEVKMINFTEYIVFSTFRPFAGRSNWSILLDILDFFDFSTFWPLAGSSNWLILLNILDFFYFTTFWPVGGRSKWSILQKILIFFDFSTFRPLGRSGSQTDRFYWVYCFFRLFDFSNS